MIKWIMTKAGKMIWGLFAILAIMLIGISINGEKEEILMVIGLTVIILGALIIDYFVQKNKK